MVRTLAKPPMAALKMGLLKAKKQNRFMTLLSSD